MLFTMQKLSEISLFNSCYFHEPNNILPHFFLNFEMLINYKNIDFLWAVSEYFCIGVARGIGTGYSLLWIALLLREFIVPSSAAPAAGIVDPHRRGEWDAAVDMRRSKSTSSSYCRASLLQHPILCSQTPPVEDYSQSSSSEVVE